ncbi:hypothetical protein SAMN04488045_0050 [Thalassococcus halodurans]|uniref:DUF2802 domain-containing protein n=1 Tax=Thalassococcus halodurans TaxID=373675 RepID=A0A1H5S1Z2_9RHOB|nr:MULTISPECIES: hypothetical protein [Thalassococcus]MBO6867909.1 hypothetical protein [Thalassococcus sp.]SEF43847.1 hypothetical protein SAMN04488045_0050 [Thalassococcus halodurans]
MTYLPLFHLAAASGFVIAVATITYLALRVRALSAQPVGLRDEDMEELSTLIMKKLEERPDTGLAATATKLDQIRVDFDWLIGERLIEQAITLAQSGQPSKEISRATGISAEEVQAIRRFRRH